MGLFILESNNQINLYPAFVLTNLPTPCFSLIIISGTITFFITSFNLVILYFVIGSIVGKGI